MHIIRWFLGQLDNSVFDLKITFIIVLISILILKVIRSRYWKKWKLKK